MNDCTLKFFYQVCLRQDEMCVSQANAKKGFAPKHTLELFFTTLTPIDIVGLHAMRTQPNPHEAHVGDVGRFTVTTLTQKNKIRWRVHATQCVRNDMAAV